MSGHSKWSKVKHQKEATDVVRGKIFTKIANTIIIAVKHGGGSTDPDSNFKLRMALDRARQVNMPKDNIERAIERAKGEGNDEALEEIVYEAYAASGVGLIIEATSDNKQRTVAEIKNILDRNGGVLVEKGGVAHLFRYVGKIVIDRKDLSFDDLMEKAINLGAIDINEKNGVEVITNPSDFHRIKKSLSDQEYNIISSELIYQPLTSIAVTSSDVLKQLNRLVASLSDHDDVQKVFANFYEEK